jgi:2-polyprenyl-6-hydroxyphenyl methylase/3-demethylubiquinone-9 3-methyltransferase
MVLATINRTLKAWGLAIVGAEYVLGWLPRGTHAYDKFLTPEEIRALVTRNGLKVTDTAGVVYNPLADQWRLSRDTAVNYMVAAAREKAD